MVYEPENLNVLLCVHAAVEYLGHRVGSKGLHTLESKVRAVVEAPHPHDQQELCSFLELVHYCDKFLQNLLHPLNNLLK